MSKYNNVNFQPVPKVEEHLHNVDKTQKQQNNCYRQVLGFLLAISHYIVAGIGLGYASVILEQDKSSNHSNHKMSKTEASWIASTFVIPMAPACLLCGFLLNKMGKKPVLIVITLVEISAWLLMYNSASIASLLCGRALSGICASMGSPIIPPYLGEISSPNRRGFYLCVVQLGLSLGLLVIHALGAFFTWNICALITALILSVYFCLVLYLPESYAWHMKNNEIDRSREAFFWYRGENLHTLQEFEKLLSKPDENVSKNLSKSEIFGLCCSKLLLMPLVISSVATITMHLSGNKVIMFYSISIVSQVIPSLGQYASTIIVDIIRIVMTCVGCVLIDKFPVRPLFIISGIGSAISHFCFATFFSYISDNSSSAFQIGSLISLISYIIFSSIGIASLPWVIAGEIFPLILKGIASGSSSFVYFLTYFIVIRLTPELFDLVGISGGFLFFGGCTLLGTVIMYFILPETKNKTLKEIEDMFR